MRKVLGTILAVTVFILPSIASAQLLDAAQIRPILNATDHCC